MADAAGGLGTGHFLDLAVRAYTLRADRKDSGKANRRHSKIEPGPRVPRYLLIFDTETTTDRCQRLNFGCWRYVRVHGDGIHLRLETVEEGLFYPDDLGTWNRAGLDVIESFRSRPANTSPEAIDSVAQLKVVPLSSFLAGQFWRAGFELQAGVVCFNWPFDVSRLTWQAGAAIDRTPKKDDPIARGFSMTLWHRPAEHGKRSLYRPDIGVKSIDSKRALKVFRNSARTDPENQVLDQALGTHKGFRGHFLDLRTLAFALTDRSHTLESACEAFEVPYEKRDVKHGQITEEYVQYCREDVEATTNLCEASAREFLRHPIDLQASRAYSPATIGKGYLRQMGVRPPAKQDVSPKILGHAMSAYYGGRAECRIRRVPVPVVYCDFLAMYPTVCSLLQAWKLLCSERMKVDSRAGARVTELLNHADPDDWLTRERWPELIGIARIRPDGNVLPVRARYGPGPSWQIGVNPLTSDESLWYSIADLVASKLLTGETPTVLEAVQFRPGPLARGLQPTSLLGEITVDPREDDFFVKVVEERKRSGNEPRGKGLKVLANGTSYGIYAEMTRHELSAKKRAKVTVYSDGDESWEWMVSAPEDPGEFCFPPLAASITGAARLMLALLERQVTDAGGTYAFCDTDSMAIVATEKGGVAPGTDIASLTWAQVDDISKRFEALKPYSPKAVPGPVLELERENFDSGEQRQLWCYAVSAKRYVLYNRRKGGPQLRAWTAPDETNGAPDDPEPASRKSSQHGLGHLMNPMDPESKDREWIADAWLYLLARDQGQPYVEPPWLDQPAIAQTSISTPRMLDLFKEINRDKAYRDQVKPFNFMLIAFVPVIERPVDEPRLVLVAPYEKDSRRWLDLTWLNRFSGREYRITTQPSGGRVTPGVVCVKSYRDVLDDYLVHPEAKSADGFGNRCSPVTNGVLRRRSVQTRTLSHIGKESNRLEDVEIGLVEDLDEIQSEYDDYYRRVFLPRVLPVLKQLGVRETTRRTGNSLGAVSRVLAGSARPRRASIEAYVAVAKAEADRQGRAPIPSSKK
jgi:hypothetical protein